MERKEITIKLTEQGTIKVAIGDTAMVLLKWITEFNRLKKSYINDGYRIIEEDLDKGYFIVEK